MNKHILSDIRGFALRESENGICQFHAQANTKAFVIMRFGCAFYARYENIIKSVVKVVYDDAVLRFSLEGEGYECV